MTVIIIIIITLFIYYNYSLLYYIVHSDLERLSGFYAIQNK